MKYLVLFLSFTTFGALAAVAKHKSNTKKHFACRENDYYCRTKINELQLNKQEDDQNSLNQFDGKLVDDVSKAMGQNDTIQK